MTEKDGSIWRRISRMFSTKRSAAALPPGDSGEAPSVHDVTAAEPTDPDRPIENPKADRFDRAAFASVLARYVAAPPSGTSLVFALVGMWGSGKTSVLHLVEHELKEQSVPVVWFNPWLFSGTHQIAAQFLKELGVALGKSGADVKRIGELVDAYAGLLEVGEAIPYIGPFLKAGRVFAQAGGKAASKQEEQSVQAARRKVAEALEEAERRIVVFIDDIDRLERDEIRQVFKLVRLVADFPNVSYLLSFDRTRVERALREPDGDDGREYLEKIVQSVFDLPDIPPEALGRFLLTELERCLADRTHGPFHDDAWADIFTGIVRPMISTPRDVVRYVNAVAPAVDILAEEVALEDLLALEAMRLFHPEVLEGLREQMALVTIGDDMASAMRRSRLDEGDQKNVRGILDLGGPHRPQVEELLRHVFPPSRFALDNFHYDEGFLREWRRERRVACREVLEFYLERNVRHGGISATLLSELVEAFSDEAKVERLLARLDSKELEATIGRLGDWVKELASVDPAPGLRAVIRAADRLRLGREQMFDFGAEMLVRRLVRWVLKSIDDETRRSDIVAAVLNGTQSFYWRLEVLGLLDGGDAYPPLVPTATVSSWETGLRAEITAANAQRLLQERQPERVVAWVVAEAEKAGVPSPTGPWLSDPGLMKAIIKSALTYDLSQELGSAALKKEPRLAWLALARLVGGVEPLREALRAVVGRFGDDGDLRDRAAKDLVGKFVSGEIDVTEEANQPSSEPS